MLLELKNITKSFGDKRVLSSVNLTCKSGRAFGLLGRNGAGKTTTIRILMNVFGANEGEILVDGRPINYSEVSFGYLPEERGLYPKKKIIDQLVYFAELKGLSRKAAVESVDFWLNRLGMYESRNKRLETLSKGNQQKIQLITALAHDPDIVILDEPFSGLDPVNALLLKEVVREIIARGRIVLFSSHQMSYIEEFCDEIAIINGGEVVLSGELREIKRNYPRNKLVVSSPDISLVEAEFSGRCVKDGENLIITLSSPDEKGEVIKRLAEGYDIDEIKVYEPSLNDIFVEYTEDRI